ncbi:MAG: saccharopine dehydrogenase NADP-binding domain-containing protein [Deltaproteobacteria bacterium]|nr:saccharopine dehydrogenase NADP-binding domain-containing protein [Deltaproteobacteria bacterium]
MKVLVLGMGLQGKAVVHDLERCAMVREIVVADLNHEEIRSQIVRDRLHKTTALKINAGDYAQLCSGIRHSAADIVVCMLPPEFGYPVARACIENRVPFVSSSYTGRIEELDIEARDKGVVILPEMGMDPGIDLLLGKKALSELDRVEGLYSYGAGLPEPAAANNVLNYKITWRFDGVLNAYQRPARYLEDGEVHALDGRDIFHPDNLHRVSVDGLGNLQAYRNGDATHYIPMFGLGDDLKHMGRFAMRYPGHAEFWYKLIQLGLTEDTPFATNGTSISPRRFLIDFLTPKMQFEAHERDVAVIRVTAWGQRNGAVGGVTYELVDYRDLTSGLFAMNRTVGFTTSIGAQMILSGAISTPGVLSPIGDVDPDAVIGELVKRGMQVRRQPFDQNGIP